MDANPSHGLKEPQRLPFESPKIRRLVLGSYWTIIILALPFWWRLTSIERIALPSVRVRTQLDKKLVFPLDVQLDAPSFESSSPRLARELNEVLAQTLYASPTWRNLNIRVGIGKHAGARNREGEQSDIRSVTIVIGDQSSASNAYTVVLGDHTAVQRPRQLVVSPEDASGGPSCDYRIISTSCMSTFLQFSGWLVFCLDCLRRRSPRYRNSALFNTTTAIGLLSRC